MTAPAPRTSLGGLLAAIMDTALQTLAAELAGTVSGPIGHTFLVPGTAVAADWCCPGDCASGPCGQAWVRLVQLYPTRVFPAPDATWSKVPSVDSAIQLELGVLRCVAGLGENGEAPAPEEMTADAIAALDDAAALRAAAQRALAPRRVVLGGYTAAGPQGYCAGGTQLFTAAISC